MLTALVLVCSLAVTPDIALCDRDNALDVMRVPEQFSSPVTCAMHGQAYVAQTAIGRQLGVGETLRIVCAPSRTVDAASVRPVPVR